MTVVVVMALATVLTVTSCSAQEPPLNDSLEAIKSACDNRQSEYPSLDVRWTKLCNVPSSPGNDNPFGRARDENREPRDSKSLQILSFKNRLRVNESALALELEFVGHFGKQKSLKHSSKYSIIDGELRTVSPSIGQGAIYPKKSIPPTGGHSVTDQIAILSNYRPQSVGVIRYLLENIASYNIENTIWGGRNALVLKSTQESAGDTSYFVDVEQPGHFLGMRYRSDDLATEIRLEVFPNTNSEQFVIQKIVHKRKVSNVLTVDEVYQDFVYDFEIAPQPHDLQVRFEPGMFITKFKDQQSQNFIFRESGVLELLNDSNIKELDPRARKALRL